MGMRELYLGLRYVGCSMRPRRLDYLLRPEQQLPQQARKQGGAPSKCVGSREREGTSVGYVDSDRN
eukprot:scaffold21752_cov56-Attheya_sp.AAC.2